MKNLCSGILRVVAPNPYASTWIVDNNRNPYPRVRAIAYKHSRKIGQMQPNDVLIMTIDLLPYWSEVCGEALVTVKFEVIDDTGALQEQIVEGNVFLNIPSAEEKYLEMKRHPKPRGLPLTLFDVSDSTYFEGRSHDG
jgi:hypothetical protein